MAIIIIIVIIIIIIITIIIIIIIITRLVTFRGQRVKIWKILNKLEKIFTRSISYEVCYILNPFLTLQSKFSCTVLFCFCFLGCC